MLKRLFSALSPETTSKNLLRFDWLEALQTPGCALCRMAQRKSWRYVETLLNEAVADVDQRDAWREPELAQAFEASSGLCWRHTLRLVEQGMQHAHLQAVLAAQQTHLQTLQDDLQEFIRKLDYRLARQPYGREADAWRRVVELYVGVRGAQGRERKD